jgi:antitoxin Phd
MGIVMAGEPGVITRRSISAPVHISREECDIWQEVKQGVTFQAIRKRVIRNF